MMTSLSFQVGIVVSLLFRPILGHSLFNRGNTHCPPFNNGTFSIHQFQLYPDMARYDPHSCLLYISSLFNGTIATFSPHTNTTLPTITFPGITEIFDLHASGLHLSPSTGILSLVIDAQPAFLTGGANASGDYFLVKYSTRSNRELWRANLTSVTEAKWSGFQDVAVDKRGNSYVIGTYPSSILKVDKSGKKITVWVPPKTRNTTVHGFTGVETFGEALLVVDSNGVPEELSEGDSLLWRFDMRDERGRGELVKLKPEGVKLGVPDAILLPGKYGGKVMLVALNYVGIAVMRSGDGWKSAELVGTVKSDFPAFFQRIIPSAVQIGEKIFMVGQSFPGEIVPGTKGGNQSDFPFFDITAEVDALLV
ncbi:hypothetical protein B0T16DRAFT_339510 [Cercophora newfieldiana]|uniref:Uncharacterized protein n=1 Tax=Cercophora newfieldiana TaxID=92897 RepID=A0AA39YN15_9PEZI|nr:hypothetical protein B0T16DRAFT_339510 [Cercophora newfieldiana]